MESNALPALDYGLALTSTEQNVLQVMLYDPQAFHLISLRKHSLCGKPATIAEAC